MAGQKLYEQVYQNIDNLLQVEKAFSEHQEIRGKLRISTFAGLQEVWAWVDEFCIQYPKVQVHCQITDRVLDLVEDNIDFAFRAGDLHTDLAVARLVLSAKPNAWHIRIYWHNTAPRQRLMIWRVFLVWVLPKPSKKS